MQPKRNRRQRTAQGLRQREFREDTLGLCYGCAIQIHPPLCEARACSIQKTGQPPWVLRFEYCTTYFFTDPKAVWEERHEHFVRENFGDDLLVTETGSLRQSDLYTETVFASVTIAKTDSFKPMNLVVTHTEPGCSRTHQPQRQNQCQFRSFRQPLFGLHRLFFRQVHRLPCPRTHSRWSWCLESCSRHIRLPCILRGPVSVGICLDDAKAAIASFVCSFVHILCATGTEMYWLHHQQHHEAMTHG